MTEFKLKSMLRLYDEIILEHMIPESMIDIESMNATGITIKLKNGKTYHKSINSKTYDFVKRKTQIT
jgi:hypothetical protein